MGKSGTAPLISTSADLGQVVVFGLRSVSQHPEVGNMQHNVTEYVTLAAKNLPKYEMMCTRTEQHCVSEAVKFIFHIFPQTFLT